jgi:hypothetical protein
VRFLPTMQHAHDDDFLSVQSVDDPMAPVKVEADAGAVFGMLLSDQRRGGNFRKRAQDLVVVRNGDRGRVFLQSAPEN